MYRNVEWTSFDSKVCLEEKNVGKGFSDSSKLHFITELQKLLKNVMKLHTQLHVSKYISLQLQLLKIFN